MPADLRSSDREELPSDAWQHPEHGKQWFSEGRCVTCGGPKEQPTPYHCDRCYSALFNTIFDYDDD